MQNTGRLNLLYDSYKICKKNVCYRSSVWFICSELLKLKTKNYSLNLHNVYKKHLIFTYF